MKLYTLTPSVFMGLLLAVSGSAFGAPPVNPLPPGQGAGTQQAPNYVGASLSQSQGGTFCDGFERCNTQDQGWKAYSGVRINQNLLMEGGYVQFGDLMGENTAGELSTASISGYTTAGVITYNYSEKIELLAKGGVFWWENELDVNGTGSKLDGKSPFFGVGANYDLGDNLGLKAEWERYKDLKLDNGNKVSQDLISLGVTFSSL
ncbi:MAG: porin family protein [Thiothrix sp.]|nr:porin family protein [Thiothrix sp.]HPQ95716.1 outer membrane beta-barrel protein [Thiolinea sp.]